MDKYAVIFCITGDQYSHEVLMVDGVLEATFKTSDHVTVRTVEVRDPKTGNIAPVVLHGLPVELEPGWSMTVTLYPSEPDRNVFGIDTE